MTATEKWLCQLHLNLINHLNQPRLWSAAIQARLWLSHYSFSSSMKMEAQLDDGKGPIRRFSSRVLPQKRLPKRLLAAALQRLRRFQVVASIQGYFAHSSIKPYRG